MFQEWRKGNIFTQGLVIMILCPCLQFFPLVREHNNNTCIPCEPCVFISAVPPGSLFYPGSPNLSNKIHGAGVSSFIFGAVKHYAYMHLDHEVWFHNRSTSNQFCLVAGANWSLLSGSTKNQYMVATAKMVPCFTAMYLQTSYIFLGKFIMVGLVWTSHHLYRSHCLSDAHPLSSRNSSTSQESPHSYQKVQFDSLFGKWSPIPYLTSLQNG